MVSLTLIFLFFLAVTLIIKRKLTMGKMIWGVIFTLWTALFLFGIVSSHVGLVLGWPNRLPYFVSTPMAMLAGLAVNWVERRFLSSNDAGSSRKRMVKYLVLTIILVSPLIHVLNINQFVYYPYSNEAQASKLLDDINHKDTERIATFGTLSYVFNVFSDGWQLDGGYVQGQINPDFYYRYHLTLTKSNDLNSILDILNKTNTRCIIFCEGQKFPAIYEDERFFDKIRAGKFVIFKLKDDYPLNFIDLLAGKAILNYSYLNPDQILIKAWYCSENVTLFVKMNYYPGWTAHSTSGEVKLIRDHDGLMIIQLLNADSADIILRYSFAHTDYIGLGATIAGAITYFLILLSIIWKVHEGWIHTRHRGAYMDLMRRRKSEAKKSKEKGEVRKEIIIEGGEEAETLHPKFKGKMKDLYLDLLLLALLFMLSLYFRSSYLTYKIPPGGDVGFHISMSKQIAEVFPLIPLYDRFSKGGVPYLYPPAAHYLMAFILLLTRKDALTVFKYANLLINVLPIIPVYLLMRRYGGKLAASMSGILFAITSIFYENILFEGFFARNLAFLLTTLTLFLLVYEKFKAATVLAGITFYTHPGTFTSLMILIIGYFILRITASIASRKITAFKKNVFQFIVLLVGVGLISLFYASLLFYPPIYSPGQIMPKHIEETKIVDVILDVSKVITAFVPWIILFFGILGAVGCLYHEKDYVKKILFIFWSLSLFIAMALNIAHIFTFGRFTWHRAIHIWALTMTFMSGLAFKYSIIQVQHLFYSLARHRSNQDKQAFRRRIIHVSSVLLIVSLLIPAFCPFAIIPSDLQRKMYGGLRSPRYWLPLTITPEDVDAMRWIKHNTEIDAVIMTNVGEGYWLEALAERKNVVGGLTLPGVHHFIRLTDVAKIYSGKVDTETLWETMNRYGANYLYAHRPMNFDNLKLIYKNRRVFVYKLKDPVSSLEFRKATLVVGSTLYLQEIELKKHLHILFKDGPKYADEVSNEILQDYNGLILNSYSCKNSFNVSMMLARYLEGGGKIFVTYDVKNPVLNVETGVFSLHGELRPTAAENHTILHDVNLNVFSPADWNGNPWDFIEFSGSNVEPLLKVQNHTVLALLRKGKGAAILDGINLIYHSFYYGNEEEMKLVANIMNWLFDNSEIKGEAIFLYKEPTHIIIEANISDYPAHLIIKQPYHPNWECRVNEEPYKVYQIFQFMGMPMPKKGLYRIELKYELKMIHRICSIISLVTIILFIIWAVYEEFKRKEKWRAPISKRM